MYFIIHISVAGLLLFIQVCLQYRLYWRNTYQNNVPNITPTNQTKVVPLSKTHHSTQRSFRTSSKHSHLSDDHQPAVLHNTQRLHRTLHKKGTFTIESVQEPNTKARNSLPQNNTISPMRNNILKTPTIIRKNSGYQIIKSISKLDTNRNQTNVLPSIPSLQELPDSVRASEIQFIGEIKHEPQYQSDVETNHYFYIIFKILNRLAISQGLIGCLLLLHLHFAVVGIIDLIAIWILRFLQFNRKWIQIFQLSLFFGFDITVLLILNIDFIWTVTLPVLLAIDVILEIVIQYTQKSKDMAMITTQV